MNTYGDSLGIVRLGVLPAESACSNLRFGEYCYS